MANLSDILGSKSRAEVLRLLFEHPGKELYLRELHRQSGLSLRPIQEELQNLQAIGLVRVRKDGNRIYFSANSENPLFPEIRSLVEKTTGVRALLQKALTDPDIQFAFIFGSVASGKAKPGSDLDLFVVGKLGLRKLTKLLSGASDRIGREVNPHVMTPQEFFQRIQENDHFISNIMNSEKMFLIGGEDDLKQLGEKRLVEDT